MNLKFFKNWLILTVILLFLSACGNSGKNQLPVSTTISETDTSPALATNSPVADYPPPAVTETQPAMAYPAPDKTTPTANSSSINSAVINAKNIDQLILVIQFKNRSACPFILGSGSIDNHINWL